MPQTDYKFGLASTARYNLIWKALVLTISESSILKLFPQAHNSIHYLDK